MRTEKPVRKREEHEHGSLRVLVASKDELLLESMRDILEGKQCSQVVVHSCKEALEYLLECEVDLVVMDPDLTAIDGVGTIELAKKLRPQIPIIVFSEDESYETTAKLARVGVYFRGAKPIIVDVTNELVKSVKKKLNRNGRNLDIKK